MVRTLVRRLASAGLASLFLATNILVLNVPKAGATPASAQVYLTLADQSKLIQQQTDVSFTTGLAPQANELQVRVDPARTYQTMDGVGAAMTESAAYLMSTKLTAQQRSLVFPFLFSKQYGAGIDVVRVPWGTTDLSLGAYTYNDNPPGGTDAPQNNFSISHDAQYMIPRLQDVKTTNANAKLFFTSWTPPAWMKTPLFPANPPSFGFLKAEYYGSYATYLTKAINGYNSNNLTPAAFTPQNEPLTGTTNYSTYFSTTDQTTLIRDHIGPAIDNNAVKPKLFAHDEDWQDVDSARTVLGDTNAAAQIDGTAFHCYNGESTKQLLMQKAQPSKEIHVTECTGSNTPAEQWDDDFRWGMRNMIINPIRNYSKSQVYWSLALDENAGPKSSGFGCQNCRGIITINSTTGAVTAGPEYYILAHYGKLVQPGATRIDSTTYGEGAVETVSFKNPNGSRVLIAMNSGSTARDFAVREGDAGFRYNLPAGAAASFIWSGTDDINQDSKDTGRLEAEAYNASSLASLPVLSNTDDGKTAKFVQLGNDEYVRFDNQSLQAVPVSFQMRYGTLFSGTVEFRQNSPTGALLGTIPFSPNNWTTTATVTGTVAPTAGTSSIYAVAKSSTSGKVINLNWFKYSQTPASSNPIAGKSGWKAYAFNNSGSDVTSNVLDGNNATRWTGGAPMTLGHWFVVDLGKQTVVDTFGAYSSGGDRPHKLRVEISDDAQNYTTLVDNYVPPADLYAIALGQKAMGRYVRLTELSEDNPGAWWSIHEINLYNN